VRSASAVLKSTNAALDEPPLQRGSAANQVFVKLRDQILQGTLARGTRLPSERELAQRYRVSAPTIREAIRGLAAMRLVEVRHGSGMYVTVAVDALFAMATSALLEVERVELVDILDILEMLYEKSAALACANATKDELEALGAAVENISAGTEVAEVAGALRDFLGLLADAAHNALISHLCKFLVGLLLEIAREDIWDTMDGWRKVGAKLRPDRLRLVEALSDRDVERAKRMSVQYHRHTKQLIRTRLAADKGDSVASMRRAHMRMRQEGLPS
jgi:GntR family transcriptional regulator, transcriptional repressor for pyruvate dehydrogenase complex